MLLCKQEKKTVASGGRFLLRAGYPFLPKRYAITGWREDEENRNKEGKNAAEESVNGEIYNKITAGLDRSVLLNTAL